MKRMNQYNWDEVAKTFAIFYGLKPKRIVKKGDIVVFWYGGHLILEFHDNGGEINIVQKSEKHHDFSVPYWDNTQSGGAVSEHTLGYRLGVFLKGGRLNYNRHIASKVANRFLNQGRTP